jgi:hypothetical protein
MLQRRTVLQLVLSAIAWGPFGRKATAHAAFGEAHAARMMALATAVLPQELGADGTTRAVDQFAQWIKDYRQGAQLDHGYGFTKLSWAPPSPAIRYPAQLDDLDRRTGGGFIAASLAERQRAVTEAVVAAGISELPARPDGGHVATDLMAHYFSSPEANDLAYEHLIGRFGCRSLQDSHLRPAALSRTAGAP